MRVMKHAFLSLIRKPTKAIMIFVILLVVYGLVFTGIIIQNSINSSREYVRKELGAVVEMRADYAKAMKDNISQEDYAAKMALSSSLAGELAKDPLVKGLYMSSYAGVTDNALKSGINMNTGDSSLGVAVQSVGISGNTTFSLTGSNADIPLDFVDGTLKITQGRHRDETDQGKDTLLISEEFALANNLSVGDMVELTSGTNGKAYNFEIIGIYSGSDTFRVDEMQASMESIQKLMKEGEEADVTTVKFLLYDPMEVEAFISQHEKQMPNDYIVLYSNDSEYETLTRPLDIISTIISILLVIVFIAGVVIMLSIITMFVRDRRFEIGLLLSSGEGKLKILSQFILEILIVSVIAFAVSAGVSKFTADYTASWIVEHQLVEDDTHNLDTGMVVSLGSSDKEKIEINDVANDFNVAIDLSVIRNLLLVSLGVVILSAGAPLLIIFGYKPRESLQN